MKQVLEKSKFLVLIGVVSLWLATAFTFFLGAYKTIFAFSAIIAGSGKDPLTLFYLIQIADVFLIATALFVFAASLHELFIGRLDLPASMIAHNLHELKTKLSSVLILVMAGTFLERLVGGKNSLDIFYQGVAIAAVCAVLIAFGAAKNKTES